MKFTEEAQALLNAAMEEQGANALKIEVVDTPEGAAIGMDFIKHSEMSDLITIDNMLVLTDDRTVEDLQSIIFDVENGQLALKQEGGCGCGCGGCCGGEGEHSHEGGDCGCGCGGDHDHEGGTCCGGEHQH